MAYYPQEIKVKSELQEKTTEVNLSCDHLTTTNFGDLNVAYYRHNTPREHFELDAAVFARPMPLQMPVMAKADHHLKFYYVPFRTISPQWNAFINKEPYVNYNGTTPFQVQEMPYITPKVLGDFLIRTDISEVVTVNDNYDYIFEGRYYRLLPLGRYAVKILNQLGYQIILPGREDGGTEHIDAMGILAYAKVYQDWYINNRWVNNINYSIKLEQLFKKDNTTAYALTAQDLYDIFFTCQKAFYNEDYFVACWSNPTSPQYSAIGTVILEDITLYKDTTVSNGNGGSDVGTPRIHNSTNGKEETKPITQYAIDSLKKMTDYCARFAMAGVRSVDRYLARFGVLLSSEKMKRSIYYGEQITPMEFGAVYSNAATSGANLGDYAGSGLINSDGKQHKHFEIESDEYGIIIGISTIIPKIGYYQGIDRNNMHHEVETYFSGIFDQLGTQAVSAAELYVSKDNQSGYTGDEQLQRVFGWLPRGVEYKTPRDRLTGDFAIKSVNAYANAWHLFREFTDDTFDSDAMVITPWFTGMYDSGQYLRIFDETNEEDGDHFNVIYQFKAIARIHAKPLYESYDFESEGKEILLNGTGPKQN